MGTKGVLEVKENLWVSATIFTRTFVAPPTGMLAKEKFAQFSLLISFLCSTNQLNPCDSGRPS